jgi:hypothetical protein
VNAPGAARPGAALCTALFFTVLLFFGPVFSARALPLEELLGGGEYAAALERGETVTEVQLSRPVPKIAPDHAFFRELTETLFARVRPSMMIENLRLYRKPEGAGGAWTEAERAALYNGITAISSLAGLEYYSSSRKTMRIFYETSSVIDGPDTARPAADPVFDTPPEHLVLYARQKDLTCGDNIYRYECFAPDSAIIMVQENITPMNISIITAIARGNLRSVVAVFDAGAYLLLYTAAIARASSFPGLGNRVSASFTTRVEAIAGWFSGQADRVFSR